MAALNIRPAEFRGEWNYTISPKLAPVAETRLNDAR
jgi:hypothetical protein